MIFIFLTIYLLLLFVCKSFRIVNKYVRCYRKTKNYIKNIFKIEFTGYDYYCVSRIEFVVDKIVDVKSENKLVCVLSVLFHGVIDDKIQDLLNPEGEKFEEFFNKLEISKDDKEQIFYIINDISFSKMMNKKNKIVF